MNVDPALRNELLATLPNLRAFALSLSHNPTRADDLVQETLLRAWANLHRFETGTNLHAWLFTILRNFYHSEYRKLVREVDDPDGSYATQLRTHPEQQAHLEFEDMRMALARLPSDQREALLLVGAEGMSYDEAGAIMGIAVGTVKSRVNRARTRLAELLAYGIDDEIGPDRIFKAALQRSA